MQIIGSSGTVIEGDATLATLRVSPRPDEGDGAYFMAGRTGLVAQPAAASPIFASRWNHPTKLMVVDLLRVRATMTTPPTTAQEWGLDAVVHRQMDEFGQNYAVASSVGATIYSASTIPKKRATFSPANFVAGSVVTGNLLIAGASALGATTGLVDVSEFMADLAWELAAGAAVARSRIFMERDYTDGGPDCPIILKQGEGILVRNVVTIGAAGVYRAVVEFAWHEVDPAEL